MRISFPSIPAACLALALGGPLAAEEISITNNSPHPWTLVWATTLAPEAEPPALVDGPEDVNFIEGGETLRIEFERRGIHRARLYDYQKNSDCLLQVTHGGEPATTVIDVLPDWGEALSILKVVEKVSARAVTLHAPCAGTERKSGPPSQMEIYRRARLEERKAASAAAPAAPPPSARVLHFGPTTAQAPAGAAFGAFRE